VECFDWRKEKESTCANRVSLHKKSNKGGQLPVGLRLYISVALQQKAGNFKVAIASRQMQWTVLTEEKKKNQLAQTECRFVKKNKGGQLLVALRLYISVALQQKAGNFNVAIASRLMQWSVLTEEKQKNQLAQTECRFVKK
jgi:hypothetical protein